MKKLFAVTYLLVALAATVITFLNGSLMFVFWVGLFVFFLAGLAVDWAYTEDDEENEFGG